MEVFTSVQAFYFDYYMKHMSGNVGFIESYDTSVPVIRVFGSTPNGERALVHIHGIFPYFYARPLNRNDDILFESRCELEKLLPDIVDKLEIEILKKKQATAESNGGSKFLPSRYVHNVEIIERKSIYGYFHNDLLFLKILLRNPFDIKVVASVLESGSIGFPCLCFEAHIPYLLQFTSDFNIQPMNWIDFTDKVKFRSPLPNGQLSFPSPQSGDSNMILTQLLLQLIYKKKDVGIIRSCRTPEQINELSQIVSQKRHVIDGRLVFRSPPRSDESQASQSSKNLGSSSTSPLDISCKRLLFSQENLDPSQQWEAKGSSNTPGSDEKKNATTSIDENKNATTSIDENKNAKYASIMEEIELLLKEITPEMLIWSQDIMKGGASGDHRENVKLIETEWSKISSCDIEFDVGKESIINQFRPSMKFGEELWEEEKNRRLKRNISCYQSTIDEKPSGRKSPWRTSLEKMTISEIDVERKLNSLFEKGKSIENNIVSLGNSSISRDDAIDYVFPRILKGKDIFSEDNNTCLSNSCEENSNSLRGSDSLFERNHSHLTYLSQAVRSRNSVSTPGYSSEIDDMSRSIEVSDRKNSESSDSGSGSESENESECESECENENENGKKDGSELDCSKEPYDFSKFDLSQNVNNLLNMDSINIEKNLVCKKLSFSQREMKEFRRNNEEFSIGRDQDAIMSSTQESLDDFVNAFGSQSIPKRKMPLQLDSFTVSQDILRLDLKIEESNVSNKPLVLNSLLPPKPVAKKMASAFDRKRKSTKVSFQSKPEPSTNMGICCLDSSFNSNSNRNENCDFNHENDCLNSSHSSFLIPSFSPPSNQRLRNMMDAFDLPLVSHQRAHFGKYQDFEEIVTSHGMGQRLNGISNNSSLDILQNGLPLANSNTSITVLNSKLKLLGSNVEEFNGGCVEFESSEFDRNILSCNMNNARVESDNDHKSSNIFAPNINALDFFEEMSSEDEDNNNGGGHCDMKDIVHNQNYPVKCHLDNRCHDNRNLLDLKKWLEISWSGKLRSLYSLTESRKLASSSQRHEKFYFFPVFHPPKRQDLIEECIKLRQTISLSPILSPSDSYCHNLFSNVRKRRFQKSKSQLTSPIFLSPKSKKRALIDYNIQELRNSGFTKRHRLTMMSVEIFCFSKKNLLPNPHWDPIQCIFWSIDDRVANSENEEYRRIHGIISVSSSNEDNFDNDSIIAKEGFLFQNSGLLANTVCELVNNEKELFSSFIHVVQTVNPDFLVGYDVQRTSIGYIIKRGNVLGYNLLKELSRVPSESPSRRNEGDEYGSDHDSGIYITGRLVINVWRRMRSELKIMTCTYSGVADYLLQSRVPYFSNDQLVEWFLSSSSKHFVIQHMQTLCHLNILLLEKLDFVRRTSECARLFGIDFYSVFTRGSQYRVEAALSKKCRHLGYVMASPTRSQVANQAPMAVIPLVMEPRSNFYVDPVIVLDYQSLYPSMMIAYNLCFSTCFGKICPGYRVEDTSNRLGFLSYEEDYSAIAARFHELMASKNCGNDIETKEFRKIGGLCDRNDEFRPYVSPNGTMFTSSKIRKGILPQILSEILDTRVMIKSSMKLYKSNESDSVLLRVLEARQLAIKLLANVTYGYTSAGFSGRMPMAELADAIVQSGRATLEWSIREINENSKWRAEVLYGGRTKEQAFEIGNEIAASLTARNPQNVVLKFEKVYQPCILVTKKRYVGMKYETVEENGILEAKGIEMIRRDQCPATMKIQEIALKKLFATKDLSVVKDYLVSQWSLILQGGDKLPLKDFIFRKEVKYGKYSPHAQPPGAIVASKAVAIDEMAVPPYRWRVPYIVICGGPRAALFELVVDPLEFLQRGNNMRINAAYYIGKCINPALIRVLSLAGADILLWFQNMAKPRARVRHLSYEFEQRLNNRSSSTFKNQSGRKRVQQSMDQFTVRTNCEVCDSENALPGKSLCQQCIDPQKNHVVPTSTVMILLERLKIAQEKDYCLRMICQNCSKQPQHAQLFRKRELIGENCCKSLDCPVFFQRCRFILRLEDYQVALEDLGDYS